VRRDLQRRRLSLPLLRPARAIVTASQPATIPPCLCLQPREEAEESLLLPPPHLCSQKKARAHWWIGLDWCRRGRRSVPGRRESRPRRLCSVAAVTLYRGEGRENDRALFGPGRLFYTGPTAAFRTSQRCLQRLLARGDGVHRRQAHRQVIRSLFRSPSSAVVKLIVLALTLLY
jgi:hypothetical protein